MTSTAMIELDGSSLTIEHRWPSPTMASESARAGARERVAAARAVVDAQPQRRRAGLRRQHRLRLVRRDVGSRRRARRALQVNLLRSHAAGVGEPLPVRAVRATMALRANVLAKGFSGIRVETLDALIALLNRRVHPPCRAADRSAPAATSRRSPIIALVLIGEGEVGWQRRRRRRRASALRRAGLTPVTLGPKEGLALINGTQVSTAVLALALARRGAAGARRRHRRGAVDRRAAGSIRPFDARIHARGRSPGSASPRNIARLLGGSAINASHANCGRVQDAYSMRCAPQVHGAARDALAFARGRRDRDQRATDNPMVFADTGEIVSGGNFHGAPIALAADCWRSRSRSSRRSASGGPSGSSIRR